LIFPELPIRIISRQFKINLQRLKKLIIKHKIEFKIVNKQQNKFQIFGDKRDGIKNFYQHFDQQLGLMIYIDLFRAYCSMEFKNKLIC